MESETNTMNILNLISIICLILGLLLDYLTILWAYKLAKREYYKSGNFLVPAILYILFVFLSKFEVIIMNKIWIISILVLMHLLIYFLVGFVMEKYINR